MKKLKVTLIIIIALNSLLLTSCNNKEELTEVQIPERESFITKSSNFPDPNTIKTKQGPFEMQGIGYSFSDYVDILKPESVYIHYDKYHLSYTNKLNTSVHGTQFERDSISGLVSKIDNNYPKLKNLSGAYYNHNIYWRSISPLEEKAPNESLKNAITESFGSMAEFKKEFIAQGNALIGSGWLWLVQVNGTLQVVTTVNNESPMMPEVAKGSPLLGIDLWEHAYYPTYEEDITAYLEMCFKHLNWDYANKLYRPKVITVNPVTQVQQ
ncbi:superoxide dismutase [Myroides odoratimimus]|uniref:superoxide dismutase n=1 Tax=Myroides odoratimimus TaxID=76832 RepID=UPI0025787942|nr:superoxide dismutase [Myroides odoratimimus]MDM1396464.1 superoxide dismutase [Myroides odoratimimus]